MPGMAHRKRTQPAVTVSAVLLLVTLCAFGYWFAVARAKSDPLARGTAAQKAGQWVLAAELARQTLTIRKEDHAALRLLARASARLGRDAAALAIYERRLSENELEAEDYLLLGLLQKRQGQPDAAARSWKHILDSSSIAPQVLEELARIYIQARHWDDAILVTERLAAQPGWEARGSMMLGTIRVELNNVSGACESFRRALELDPAEVEQSHDPTQLRKLIARTFLRMARPAEALAILKPMRPPAADSEAAWLLSRAYLQDGDKAKALAARKQAGAYRAANPLDPEPSPYVGEARCEECHVAIYRDSLASRHTQTYYRGAQLDSIPLPDHPLPDPEDRGVTHTLAKRDGRLHEQTRVGQQVFDAVVEYAFGTADRYLTMVTHDSSGAYHIARLSSYQTPNGTGWDRSSLDRTHPTRNHPADFQGEMIGVRDGLARCLYCHLTNPRTGREPTGPETADRAIGCERCHGPGGNHILAQESNFPDPAISNPAGASPAVVTTKQCNDCHILDRSFRHGNPDDPGWARSQGVGWTLSRCNTESGGAFGCVTCHDPHKSAGATSTIQYEAKCLGCHTPTVSTATLAAPGKSDAGARSTVCPVNAKSGCIDCHMPRVRVELLHTDLADHNIRIHRQEH